MNYTEFAARLRDLMGKGYIVELSDHVTKYRAPARQMDINEIEKIIRNPPQMGLVEELPAGLKNGEKFKLWFVLNKRIWHKYIVLIDNENRKIIVKTVMKIRTKFQKRFDRHVKRNKL